MCQRASRLQRRRISPSRSPSLSLSLSLSLTFGNPTGNRRARANSSSQYTHGRTESHLFFCTRRLDSGSLHAGGGARGQRHGHRDRRTIRRTENTRSASAARAGTRRRAQHPPEPHGDGASSSLAGSQTEDDLARTPALGTRTPSSARG